jgi:hypothetical protein
MSSDQTGRLEGDGMSQTFHAMIEVDALLLERREAEAREKYGERLVDAVLAWREVGRERPPTTTGITQSLSDFMPLLSITVQAPTPEVRDALIASYGEGEELLTEAVRGGATVLLSVPGEPGPERE